MRFRGRLYRALNPIYAREPLSGQGAQKYGGRFNARGTAALYVSTSLHTAIREANQLGDLQPTTIVSYDADLDRILDSRDPLAIRKFGMTVSDLADPTWRDQMRRAEKSRTQQFAEDIVSEGFHGLLVRSFARGATDRDLNIVLWRWGDQIPTKITVIDDERRLSRI